MDDDEVRFTTTEQLTEGATFETPTVVLHSHRGPMCHACERVNSPQFCSREGVLNCQHCGSQSGFMAGPQADGFLWSTWPILPDESEGK